MSFQYLVPMKKRSMWVWVAITRHPITIYWRKKLIIFLYVVLGCTTCSCNAGFSYGHLITRKILTDRKSTRAQVIFICHSSVTFHPSPSPKRKKKAQQNLTPEIFWFIYY